MAELDGGKSGIETIGGQSGGSHWFANVDDMLARGLDDPEYWEQMKREGKVVEDMPLGAADFPSVLIGVTEEQVHNEIQPLLYTLPLADLLETIHAVLRENHVQYECKNLLGTDTYIFDFPQIEEGRLLYIEVRPKLINPGFSFYDGYSFPDATYDKWGEWARWLHGWMARSNLTKALNYWCDGQRYEIAASINQNDSPKLPEGSPERANIEGWKEHIPAN